MKEWILKNIVGITISIASILFIIVIINAVIGYIHKPVKKTEQVIQSKDTTYAPTVQENFRPQSIPILEKKKPDPVKLPSDVKQEDVASSGEIIHTDVQTGEKDTTEFIVLKDGTIEAPKEKNDKVTTEVHQFIYVDPILAIGLFPKAGVDGNTTAISPVVGVGIIKIYGVVQLPVLALDLHGAGAGVDVKVYREWSAGVMYHFNWQFEKDFRLTLCYDF